MRIALIALLSLLAGCVSQNGQPLGKGPPGLNVARAALAAGSPDLALAVANGILASDPRNLPARLAQGDALSTLGRLDEAETSYTGALAADPRSVDAQVGLARLRLRSDPVQAQALLLSVLQQEPHNAIALNDLGIADDLLGDHEAAQASYRKVLGVDPGMRAAQVNLALSMGLSGQAPEAAVMLRQLADDPAASRREHHDLAAVLALAGDERAAAGILARDMTPADVQRALQAYGQLRQ